jgi:DMSO/TMAO reductase YedYZ molybdopterin-dependent catalytic subunit
LTPITPNDRFYVVTKNVIDPDVKRSLWWLEIRGAVAAPQAYSYEALTALPSVDQRTTLQCISNSVGGGLVSNAVWRGVPLRALLIAARPSPAAVQILLQGVDGYRDTIPLEQALAEHTLVAYAMNGDSLPGRHGFPVRLIVPGLVGEKSVKWLTRVVVNEKPTTGFYEGQGWGPNFVLQTHSRFYAPDFGRPLPAGAPIVLRGTAFAGARGIREVDVRVDDGPWQRADIDYSGAAIEWVHWRMVWTPERPGEYRLTVRATDGDGVLQTAVERGFAPEGATGHHRVVARVVNTAA